LTVNSKVVTNPRISAGSTVGITGPASARLYLLPESLTPAVDRTTELTEEGVPS